MPHAYTQFSWLKIQSETQKKNNKNTDCSTANLWWWKVTPNWLLLLERMRGLTAAAAEAQALDTDANLHHSHNRQKCLPACLPQTHITNLLHFLQIKSAATAAVHYFTTVSIGINQELASWIDNRIDNWCQWSSGAMAAAPIVNQSAAQWPIWGGEGKKGGEGGRRRWPIKLFGLFVDCAP